MPMDYHVRGTMLERYQTYRPNQNDVAELKTASLTICNDLSQKFIDTAVVSFRNSFRRVLLQLVDILNMLAVLNT